MSYFPPTGSTVAFQSNPNNLVGTVSVVGTLPVVTNNASVIATLINSSVTALQGTNPWFVQLTSGSVITAGGNSSVQVVGIVPPSSVSGVGIFNTNPIGNGSIITVSTGSIATAPFPASVSGVGVFNVNHTGVGSIFTGFRNDAIASTVGVNLTSRLIATDSAGRTVTKPFSPEESTVRGNTSTVSTGVTSLIGAPGVGLRTYVTEFMVSNMGSVATLVRFADEDNVTLAKTIAPPFGGSNKTLSVAIVGPANQGINITASPAVSILHAWAAGYKAP